jgi:hypothetical protein
MDSEGFKSQLKSLALQSHDEHDQNS